MRTVNLKTVCYTDKIYVKFLKDVREEKEFQVSRLHKAYHVNPSLTDLEEVIKLISETGTSLKFNTLLLNLRNKQTLNSRSAASLVTQGQLVGMRESRKGQ